MQFQNLPCPEICKWFPTVPFPGVVSFPPRHIPDSPSSRTTHRMVQTPSWSTLSNCESFCLHNYFICHTYLTRRARELLQGWGIVVFLCSSFGIECEPLVPLGWLVLLMRPERWPRSTHEPIHCSISGPKPWHSLTMEQDPQVLVLCFSAICLMISGLASFVH